MRVAMVFWPPLGPEWMQKVGELGIEVREARSEQEALARIADADALYGRLTPALLASAERLRWVHATSAGLDGFFFPELRESAITVTNMRGVYSDVIADHVFAYILCFARGLHLYMRRQVQGKWAHGEAPVTHLAGTTLGVIGLGGIGLEVAARGRAFGMRVLAVDPAPKDDLDHVEVLGGSECLHDLLGRSDFAVICVPHTGETEHLIDPAALKAMKPSAILINVGRGKVVDTEALVAALTAGTIGGAGLDVFEEEPLPEGHPLWQMENVMITPHVASVSPEIEARRNGLLLDNIRRFCRGERLLNVVDKQRGYVVERNP